MQKPIRRIIFFVLIYCLLTSSLAACDIFPGLTETNSGTPVNQDDTTLNTWLRVGPGSEIRTEQWKSSIGSTDTVTISRFDLQKVHLSVSYQPDQPLYAMNWAKQTDAVALINGGYFDQENHPTALLISDGVAHGTSYQGFGGMLAVDAQGHVSLRSLHQYPYQEGEALQQVTQSSPMLMIDGQRTDFQADAASQRRSVVAIDKEGRLLFIVSPSNAFSLDELADLLVSSDLSLQTALNLDGGASTGLYVKGEKRNYLIDSLTKIPIVVVIK